MAEEKTAATKKAEEKTAATKKAEEKSAIPETAAEKRVPEKVVGEGEQLPKNVVRRLVKEKLSQLSKDDEILVLRETLQAFSETSRIFIHYLSAAANDVCKESKRQTISSEDVFKALEDIEFPEFVAPLKASLDEFRQKNAVKRSGSSKMKEAKKSKKEKSTKTGIQEKQNSNVGNEDNEEASIHDNDET